MARVFLAEKPKRRLASRCKLVRSNIRGESCVEGLLSSVTTPGLPRHLFLIVSALARSQIRSALRSGSASFPSAGLTNLSSNQRPAYWPAARVQGPINYQKVRETER